MTPSNMTARVTAATCALVALLAAPAGWLGGSTAALGVLAGGALAVVNFRWLAARAVAVASSTGVAGRRRAPPRRVRRGVRGAARARVGASGRAAGRAQRASLRGDRRGAARGKPGALTVEIIEHPPIVRLPGIFWPGYVPDHVTYTWLVMIVLTALAFVASRRLELVPRGV